MNDCMWRIWQVLELNLEEYTGFRWKEMGMVHSKERKNHEASWRVSCGHTMERLKCKNKLLSVHVCFFTTPSFSMTHTRVLFIVCNSFACLHFCQKHILLSSDLKAGQSSKGSSCLYPQFLIPDIYPHYRGSLWHTLTRLWCYYNDNLY